MKSPLRTLSCLFDPIFAREGRGRMLMVLSVEERLPGLPGCLNPPGPWHLTSSYRIFTFDQKTAQAVSTPSGRYQNFALSRRRCGPCQPLQSLSWGKACAPAAFWGWIRAGWQPAPRGGHVPGVVGGGPSDGGGSGDGGLGPRRRTPATPAVPDVPWPSVRCEYAPVRTRAWSMYPSSRSWAVGGQLVLRGIGWMACRV